MSRHELELTIEALALGGLGVGRLPSGKAVLVHRGLPGDRLRARVLVEKRSYCEAIATDCLVPGSERISPECPVADRCGGCDWMALDIASQRRWKVELLARELARAGLVEPGEGLSPMVSGAAIGVRTRCRLHLRRGVLGTMATRSTEVIPLAQCPILAPPLEAFALELARAAGPGEAELELSVDVDDRRGLSVEGLRSRAEVSRWRSLARALGVEALRLRQGPPRRRQLFAEGRLTEASADERFLVEPGVFTQASRALNALLVAAALGSVGHNEAGRFVEAYAGAGNFTVHLARRFSEGLATEGDRRAAALLARNLRSRPVEVVAESDERTARRLASQPRAQLLFVDPPRAGMKALYPLFAAAPPGRVVLVSCHPMAAVRDLRHLVDEAGYRLATLLPVDLFPQTHHLELVAVLERG